MQTACLVICGVRQGALGYKQVAHRHCTSASDSRATESCPDTSPCRSRHEEASLSCSLTLAFRDSASRSRVLMVVDMRASSPSSPRRSTCSSFSCDLKSSTARDASEMRTAVSPSTRSCAREGSSKPRARGSQAIVRDLDGGGGACRALCLNTSTRAAKKKTEVEHTNLHCALVRAD